jgi:sigma-B regulation protein RsbU (phosphoserine phosphatase)
MFYASYNAATGRLTYANAGHNRPLLHRRGEASCIELDAEGLIIGVKRKVIFEECSTSLQPGDVLLLYTDGLTEAARDDGEMFGCGRVCQILGEYAPFSAAEIIDALYQAVTDFTGSQILQDDVSLVVIKIV